MCEREEEELGVRVGVGVGGEGERGVKCNGREFCPLWVLSKESEDDGIFLLFILKKIH